jgi:predicted phosphodiesterase
LPWKRIRISSVDDLQVFSIHVLATAIFQSTFVYQNSPTPFPSTKHLRMSSRRKLRIICISDTHNKTPALPAGDLLIHAGDITNAGTLPELVRAATWLERVSGVFAATVVVAGNHDRILDRGWATAHECEEDRGRAVEVLVKGGRAWMYLEHEVGEVEVHGGERRRLRVFGSPMSRTLGKEGQWAFGYHDSAALLQWETLRNNGPVDIVVVHGPPKGFCDEDREGRSDGCEALLDALGNVRPRLVVCGHRHEGRGCVVVEWIGSNIGRRWRWIDGSVGSKKISLVDLTGRKGRWVLVRETGNGEAVDEAPLEVDDSVSLVEMLKGEGRSWTCVVNAAIMANSYGDPKEAKKLNKPIVVDIEF